MAGGGSERGEGSQRRGCACGGISLNGAVGVVQAFGSDSVGANLSSFPFPLSSCSSIHVACSAANAPLLPPGAQDSGAELLNSSPHHSRRQYKPSHIRFRRASCVPRSSVPAVNASVRSPTRTPALRIELLTTRPIPSRVTHAIPPSDSCAYAPSRTAWGRT